MSKQKSDKKCSHLELIQEVTPSADGCEECLAIGDNWVALRICLICGHVGCCDDSKNMHASKHFHTTGHPIVQLFEESEQGWERGWMWCYEDQVLI